MRRTLRVLVFAALLSSHALAADFAPVLNTGAHAWGDYNNDGWSDLFGGKSLWRNNQGDGFTKGSPFGEFDQTAHLSMADYNNDGYIDAYAYRAGENGAGGPRLYTSVRGRAWRSATSRFRSATVTPAWVHRATTWGDFDNDGFLDTYVSAWCEPWLGVPDDDMIYMSDEGNSFAHTWTSPTDQFGLGVSTVDFDRDGDLDIYVSNYWQTPNFLWRNTRFNGRTGFTDVAATYGLDDGPGHTIGSTVGDFNNDGDFDIFICNFAHPGNPELRFMENRGRSGNFRFRNRGTCGVRQMEPMGAATAADYDNDGDLDLFITVVGGYGGERAQIYRNNGNWSFSNVTSAYGLNGMTRSADGATDKAAWGDYNNDGFLDLLADNKLWRNPGVANWRNNHYLKVKLEGGEGPKGLVNRSAIGAQVRIDVPDLGTTTRQVSAGTGKGMQNDLVLHFGLGGHSEPVDLDILWPGGVTQTVSGVAVDQFVTIGISASFLRGDCDGDGKVGGSPSDAVLLLAWAFRGEEEPPCLAACDMNGDGAVSGTPTDAVLILVYAFRGGPEPPAPFPDCGASDLETDRSLGCATPPDACR